MGEASDEVYHFKYMTDGLATAAMVDHSEKT